MALDRWTWAPARWREFSHLALGLVQGLLLLAVLLLFLLLSPVLLVWPRAALAALSVWRGLLRGERLRYSVLLAELLAGPAPRSVAVPASRAVVHDELARPWARRSLAYSLVRAPLSLLQIGVVTLLITWPLVMLATGVRGLAGGQWPVAGPFAGSLPLRAGVALLLLALVVVAAPIVVRHLVRLDVIAAQALLGRPETPDLEARIGELVESRQRVLSSAEAERERIERDIHDGAQQRLIALGILLGRTEERLLADSPDGPAVEFVRQAKAETRAVIAEIRALTRGLRPPILESRGLDAALSSVAARLGVPARITAPDRFVPDVEAVLYFAVSECLTNVAKHATGAPCRVSIDLVDGRARAVVTDEGMGGAALRPGSGLAGISDRLAGQDGRLYLSSPPGGPTVVTVDVPCAS
jgi:signal transduction histidine kinase